MIFLLPLIMSIIFSLYTPAQVAEEAVLGQLSEGQKVGQLFIIGIDGTEVNDETRAKIEELHPGGILLLGKNIETEGQVKKLISDLQAVALEDTGLPLFIAVDQEGGLVNRISFLEENTAQRDIESEAEAFRVGLKRGEELKELGINLNFSPLLDKVQKTDFIFERAFRGPEGSLGAAMIRGQKESGILSCIKHFPGYGEVSFNPEDSLARRRGFPELKQFKKAMEARPEMVMVANVIYNELEEVPFTFSKKGIDLLKEELGKEPLVITDDLDQYSLLNNYSLKEIVTKPIIAGADMMIFSGWRLDPEEGVKTLRNSDLDINLVNRAVLRIIKLKQKLK